MSRQFSRRAILGGATVGSLAWLTGCVTGSDDSESAESDTAACVPRSSVLPFEKIGPAALYYELTETRQPFLFNSQFHDQLQVWLAEWSNLVPAAEPDRIDTYGAWIEGSDSCSSWHNSGRAFDLARLRKGNERLVSARYDSWSEQRNAASQARNYWALTASLLLHFDYVVTYAYNEEHHNHIHIDNAVSGQSAIDQPPTAFRSRSRTQLLAIQSICRWLWDRNIPATGRWDEPTQTATHEVLHDLDQPTDLSNPASWRGFLVASARLWAPLS